MIGIVSLSEDRLGKFAEELRTLGHEVNHLELTAGPDADVVSIVSTFMQDAASMDIIHNSAGACVLAFADLVPTPVVTVLDQPAKVSPGVGKTGYFIAEKTHDLVERSRFFVADPTDAASCIAVYEHILVKNKREDVRPWGFYTVLSDEMDDHKIKRITVNPGKRLSLQLHSRRREHWVVVSGDAVVTRGDERITLGPSGSVDIPMGTAHRIENIGITPLVFIEVQQGDYFGEDDIVRIEDDFGRQ